jgi:hypothetical protein
MLTYADAQHLKAYSPFAAPQAAGRCSVYLLYWYKSTNTDADAEVSMLGALKR